MTIYTAIGWIGTVSYVLAYFLLARGVLSADKKMYHMLNIVGGTCLVVNALSISDFPNVIVNAVWGSIAAYMVIKISRNQHKPNKS